METIGNRISCRRISSMSMSKEAKYIGQWIIGILTAVMLIMFGWQMKETQLDNTYKSCLVAHNEINGQSEQHCADMQDYSGTEFVCNQSNTSCWLEL